MQFKRSNIGSLVDTVDEMLLSRNVLSCYQVLTEKQSTTEIRLNFSMELSMLCFYIFKNSSVIGYFKKDGF